MRILIVEDKQKTARYLKKGLSEHGFVVDTAHDGLEGLFQAREIAYDLVLLDVNLPKLDGWEVIKSIRKQKPNLLVLFLTAKDEVEDRVKGLELGADDYLIKPFAFSELLARIRTLLKRNTTASETTCYKIADLELNLLKHTAIRKNKRISLTPKEFSLLALLMKKTGEVLTRTLIAEKIWDMNFDSDTNVVDVAIRRLRRKIDDNHEKKLIHTIRGVGYVFEDKDS